MEEIPTGILVSALGFALGVILEPRRNEPISARWERSLMLYLWGIGTAFEHGCWP